MSSLRLPPDQPRRPRWRAALAIACGTVLAAGEAAAAAPAVTDAIVDAEHQFAARVAADGIGPGFLAYLADSAVVLTPEPKPARALYEGLKEDGTRLTWRPDLASTSSAGDFGWASGPWLRYSKGATSAELGGHYFTVWRRTAGDGWKVLLDGGVSYPVAVAQREALPEVAPRIRRTHAAGTGVDPPCEARFFGEWQRKGRARALDAYAARDVRLLAASVAPVDGRANLASDALRDAPLVAARVARRLYSPGGDIYVAYGEYEIGNQGQYGKRHYAFAMAYDATDNCRLALELVTPMAAAGPAQP